MACQQFVKQNAERIDIARRGDLIAAHLLRAGVFRRQQMQPRSRQRAGGVDCFGSEQFGDAEIEQFDDSVFGNEDVRRFEVAVDDQMLMRVRDG